MGEVVRLILDLLRELLPVRIIWHWQQGLYFVCGRCVGVVGPGLKLVVPYICDVKPISIVPEIETTPLQTVTLRNGQTLTYSASLTIVVVDVRKAYLNVGHWSETVVELAAGMMSAMLAEEDPVRITDPSRGKRDNMLDDIRSAINDECKQFGVEVLAIRLGNFALGVRTIRLLTDTSVLKGRERGVN